MPLSLQKFVSSIEYYRKKVKLTDGKEGEEGRQITMGKTNGNKQRRKGKERRIGARVDKEI